MTRIITKYLGLILGMIFSFATTVDAADLIFVDGRPERDGIAEMVEIACAHYGIDCHTIDANEFSGGFSWKKAGSDRSIGGVIINARSLPQLQVDAFLAFLRMMEEKNHGPIPVLVTGFGEGTNTNMIRLWSGGILEGVEKIEFTSGSNYRIVKATNLTFELSDLTFQINEKGRVARTAFRTAPGREYSPIINMIGVEKGKEIPRPVFLELMNDGVKIFFHTGTLRGAVPVFEKDGTFRGERFIEIAPILMFLRHAFGEACWHIPHPYANLTIDDPWLIEPYGHLRYMALLSEMERTNFHTTIAFVPWNFDRNSAEVQALFLKHNNRFSLAIHGNNHDHKEFDGKSPTQEEDLIRQALARMEIMSNKTGLPYDRVMIFPHEVSSAKTLGLLKKYNFLATISLSAPIGAKKSTDPIDTIRSVNLMSENFPIVQRSWIKNLSPLDPSRIAVDLFLNGFIILCGHHDVFEGGIDAFNKFAGSINRIRPDIRWSSLGDIARHLYYQKSRDDGDVEVIAYSSEIILENGGKHDAIYHVRKEESFTPPIREVLVGGLPHYYKFDGGSIVLTLEVKGGGSRDIRIVYENIFDPSNVDISKQGARIYLLRVLSDFRDRFVSKNKIGRLFLKYYYGTGFYRHGMLGLIAFFLILGGAPLILVFLIRKKRND